MAIQGLLVRGLLGMAVAGALLVLAPAAMGDFGVQSFNIAASNRDGSPDVQAGSHPYEVTSTFTLNPPREVQGRPVADGNLRDIEVELPPGLVGNPNATPKCDYETFIARACANDTAVGVAVLALSNGHAELFFPHAPIYNIEPSPGHPAEFGFRVTTVVPIFLDAAVRTGGDYGVTVSSRNVSQAESTIASRVIFWGVPADPSHDPYRGECLGEAGLSEPGKGSVEEPFTSRGNCPVNVPLRPFLTNPTSCGTPRTATLRVDSWQEPGSFISKLAALPALSGCEKLGFNPSLNVTPDETAGSTPTGLNVDLHLPQDSALNPAGLGEANVRDTKVTLPAGVQLSPSAADGLLACSPAQIGLHNSEPVSCPEASKVGTVEIDTPLLSEPLTGAVYLATQNENPFGSLIALYIVAEDKAAGVLVKLAGQTTPDPVTGQLVTMFEDNPQLPFSDFKLHFFGGARAPLTTPALCGTYTTQTAIAPWSGTPAVSPSSQFQITSGPGGAPCADPLPFAPGFTAGTTNIQAGAFSPFALTLTRPDGDQPLGSVSVQMPPGLLGVLASVKLCGEPRAAQGTCGPESLIGHTIASAGLGVDPYTVTGGRVYITGPYRGAPFGLSILVPAVAGPFNLGNVIVRSAISIDPHTAQITATSDPLPTILRGIPLQLQHVNVTIDRAGFMFNPTSCEPLSVGGTLTSAQGASAVVSSRFQAAGCAALGFHPSFSVSSQARASKANGASLDVRIGYPSGAQANIHSVAVTLPKQLPSRLTTIQQACLEAVFNANPASCPAGSDIGTAVASTPVLSDPVVGPAYLVSHGGAAFPDLVVILQGEGVTVDLTGSIDIRHGVTSSTFANVPDVPISGFDLTLPEGPHSALTSNLPGKAKGSLCGQSLVMPTTITGQNGAVIKQSTRIKVTGCLRAKKKHKATHGGRRRKRARKGKKR